MCDLVCDFDIKVIQQEVKLETAPLPKKKKTQLMQPCMLWRYLIAFNRISVGTLPTNSPVITISDDLGDSCTPSSTIFASYVTRAISYAASNNKILLSI